MKPRRSPRVGARPGSVRIIGGRWRGTRLDVPEREGLRPSPDRLRETLFNWLQPWLPGARVLDLFAGTGVLGLEAASRGAAHVQLVERDAALAAAIASAAARLGDDGRVHVQPGDALQFLPAGTDRYDIAFVDPPFGGDLWQSVWELLPARMADASVVHVESPPGMLPVLPADWQLHREARSREVRLALYRRVTLGRESNSGET